MKTALLVILWAATVYAHHHKVNDAPACNPSLCLIENNCRCSSTINPISDTSDPSPQLLAITISESIVEKPLYNQYIKPLFFDRVNPDGKPIGLSFYVNHEYTDYRLVQDLYLRGYDIGDHSITKKPNQTYWRTASLELLQKEFCGQKTILSTFANIPEEDIVGARVPQLQLEADVTINAYTYCGLNHDNSWPALPNNRVFPYTLDYATTQQCTATEHCPVESHPGFWIAPITDIKGPNGTECNSLATCGANGTVDEIATWLRKELDNVKSQNRAPLILRLDSYWFDSIETSFAGFTQFLDQLTEVNDVFLVTVSDVLAWIKNPVPLSGYSTPVHDDRYAECLPVLCQLKNAEGAERNMGSCIPCPDNYPWLDNPLGK